MLIIPGLHEDIILGKTWLDKHNPVINWPTGEVQFVRCACPTKMEVSSMVENSVELVTSTEDEWMDRENDNLGKLSDDDSDINWDLSEDDEMEFSDVEIVEEDVGSERIRLLETVVEDGSTEFVKEFLGDLKETKDTIAAKLPSEYSEYAELFSEKIADELPPVHSKYQCCIEFKKDSVLPKPQKPYPVSFHQRSVVEKYVQEGLKKGSLRKSKSPIAMPLFLVPKKDGDDIPVVDFRLINDIIVDNRNPISCIDDIMSYLSKAKVFSKINSTNAYNLIRIREGDEWKTAFVCHLGQFEYTVMPFGIKTAPAIFQSMMNDIFRDLLVVTVLIYLDDILIFSENETEHLKHVREVLQRLKENRLLAKLKKCLFHVSDVEFLGYVVSKNGVEVAKDKVEVIKNWPKPTKRRELKSFLGTANFNRKFIENYTNIVAPLLALDSKSVTSFKDAWDAKCDEAFEKLKLAMTSTPVLKHVDFELPFWVETDASDYALGRFFCNHKVVFPVFYDQ